MQTIFALVGPDGRVKGMFLQRKTAERKVTQFHDGSRDHVVEYRPVKKRLGGVSDLHIEQMENMSEEEAAAMSLLDTE